MNSKNNNKWVLWRLSKEDEEQIDFLKLKWQLKTKTKVLRKCVARIYEIEKI